jgi:hypothetical protein
LYKFKLDLEFVSVVQGGGRYNCPEGLVLREVAIDKAVVD